MESQASIFQRCCALVLAKSVQCVKTMAFPRFFHVFHISRAFCAHQKTTQHRSKSLSNGASHQDRGTNSFWGSPDWSLEGSGATLGASWTSLGQLLGDLGRLLTPLGRSLGACWTLLGRSWASLGRPGMDLGHILAQQDGPSWPEYTSKTLQNRGPGHPGDLKFTPETTQTSQETPKSAQEAAKRRLRSA